MDKSSALFECTEAIDHLDIPGDARFVTQRDYEEGCHRAILNALIAILEEMIEKEKKENE